MAAAAFFRNVLRELEHRGDFSRHMWNHGIEHSARRTLASPCNFGNQLRHSKSFSRFAHSSFRKIKELEILPNGGAFNRLLSRTCSSSSKFSLAGWYLSKLKTRPVLTKSVTASLIYTAADASSQTIIGEDQYNAIRTLRMAGYGMLILGPSLHYWFNFMSGAFPKRDLLSTFKKMASGQLLFGPTMTVVFFSVNAFLQGESGSDIFSRLRRDVPPTIINGIMYWPICDFITYRFIPVPLQPLATNSFSYVWTIYMTYMASLAKANAS